MRVPPSPISLSSFPKQNAQINQLAGETRGKNLQKQGYPDRRAVTSLPRFPPSWRARLPALTFLWYRETKNVYLGSFLPSFSSPILQARRKMWNNSPPPTQKKRNSVTGLPGALRRGHRASIGLHRDDDSQQDDPSNPMAVLRVKPKDQLQLSPEELRKRMPPRILYPQNPRAPKNLALYSFKEKLFKRDEQIEQTVFHLAVDGALLHVESQEAIDQEEAWRMREEEAAKRKRSESVEISIEDDLQQNNEDEGRVLRNQFNYGDRASQTETKTIRERGAATRPPPTVPFAGTVNQWMMHDAYVEELNAQSRSEADHKTAWRQPEEREEKIKRVIQTQDTDVLSSMKWVAKLTERVVNHNSEIETYQNFRNFREPAGNTSEAGAFLQLWQFHFSKVKKKDVTSLKWNPRYPDLFAAGYGSYEFQKQGVGFVCCYTLKNTGYPEYFWKTESAVCSLDWNQHNPSLLAVGLYDGTVLVLNVHAKDRKPTHASTVKVNKHTDPVWDVRWDQDNSSSTMRFYSVSGDGRVTSWSLMKNKLESEEVTLLKLDYSQLTQAKDSADATALIGIAGGTCFDFHPTQQHIFIVGTTEGRIFKCSKNYSGQYLQTYWGHDMSVTRLEWNPFHPRIFISSSSDWTVKIWDDSMSAPVLSFDFELAVNDARWAPYSATMFVAATADGMVHLYDLDVNRRKRTGSFKVSGGVCLSRVCFNPTNTILLAAEEGGRITTLKLCTQEAPLDLADGKTEAQARMEKMNNVLTVVSDLFQPPSPTGQQLPHALRRVCDEHSCPLPPSSASFSTP
ncbi:WD domain, G-beta repeat-containing protein [Besnoitia besnoiti]|uniref:WD domain, G-beta repeat-containing protein n=1 Tax=Besnoitia besnoiti TaxID=94643 RepID=A0A2A9M857_BESBE|nr:WD domain, G-beta repeat-containing protein [Besnoitia besnoiti]PFH31863.1 WD domain, G-beta repeat-containing protein [Besnoitia besnoiti]